MMRFTCYIPVLKLAMPHGSGVQQQFCRLASSGLQEIEPC
jgi:hypothetical protein